MQRYGERVSTFQDLGYCTVGDTSGSVTLILSNDLWHSWGEAAASVFSLIRRSTQTEWQSPIRKGA